MTQRWYYSVDADTVLEITDRLRLLIPDGDAKQPSFGSHAEEGSGASVSAEVDDYALDLIMLQHRRVYSTNDGAPAGGQVCGNWFIQDLDVVAQEAGSQKGRKWLVTMVDENSLTERRVFVGASSVRPEETDIERILWMLGETELNTLSPDLTYIDQTGPVTLDAGDYTLQKPSAVLEHAKKASGKNYWIKYEEAAATGGAIVSSSVANPSVITMTTAHGLVTGQQVTIAGHTSVTPDINGIRTVTVTGANTFTIPVNVTDGGTGGTISTVGRYVLAYYDAGTWDGYPSTLSLSNVAAEINSTTVFAISDDTRLNRSGDRSPVSGMVVPYTGGYVYEQDTAVGDTYVYRDVAAPSINIKSAAKATAAAERELAELATPDDEVELEIVVQEEQINLAMHGMSINLHATHLPPYTEETVIPAYATGQAMRIMRRQVRQIGPTTFGVRLWLTPMETTGDYMLSFIIQRSDTQYGSAIVPRGTDNGGASYHESFTWLGGALCYPQTPITGYPMDVAYLPAGPVRAQWIWGGIPGLNGTSRPTGFHLLLSGTSGPPVYLGDYPTTPGYTPSLPTQYSPEVTAPDNGIMFAVLWALRAADVGLGAWTLTGPSGAAILRQTMSSDILLGDPGGDTYPDAVLAYKMVTASEVVEFVFVDGGTKQYVNTAVVFVPGDAVTIDTFTHSGSNGSTLAWSW